MTLYALLAGVLDPIDEHHRMSEREREEPTDRERLKDKAPRREGEAILGIRALDSCAVSAYVLLLASAPHSTAP